MQASVVRQELRRLARRYPFEWRARLANEVERQTFHMGLVGSELAPAGAVADIGGGTGLFSAGCAALGMSATLIDDFADPVNEARTDELLDLHRSVGVKIDVRDVVRDRLGPRPGRSMSSPPSTAWSTGTAHQNACSRR